MGMNIGEVKMKEGVRDKVLENYLNLSFENICHQIKQTVQTGSGDNPSVCENGLSGSQRRVKTGDNIQEELNHGRTKKYGTERNE